MKTIKIKETIQRNEEIEKEISVPSYWTYGNFYYWKIVDAVKAVVACNGGTATQIGIQSALAPFRHREIVECTKEEFDAAFARAAEAINNLNVLQTTEQIPA